MTETTHPQTAEPNSSEARRLAALYLKAWTQREAAVGIPAWQDRSATLAMVGRDFLRASMPASEARDYLSSRLEMSAVAQRRVHETILAFYVEVPA